MGAIYSSDKMIQLENKYEDYLTIFFLLRKHNFDIPKKLYQDLLEVEKEIKKLEEIYEKYNGLTFLKTFFSKKEGKNITFTIICTGHFISFDKNNWLIAKNPRTGSTHLIKLNKEFEIDENWLVKNNIELPQPTYEDDIGFDPPCDIYEECGISCVNCF